MSNIAIVFWSATGNTEAMADAVKAGAQEAGAEVSVFSASDFSADMVADFDAIAFGCPAMGDGSFRLLRLGRRSVDARLAGVLSKRRRIPCL